jgi:hypothetical protein
MAKGRISARKSEVTVSTLPEVGKIKIGEKIKNAKGVEYPTSLDYFRATGSFANEFTKIYGDKPKKLNIAFISDDLEEVCNERYECWIKGKRYGYGDGEKFTVWSSETKSYISDLPATDQRVRSLKWDSILTLRFILLEMRGIMGYWTFSSKGKMTTIPSVVKSFDFVREKANTIIGFPFNLMVEKKTGYSPDDPKSYPIVTLVPNFSEESIEMVRSYIEQGGTLNRITTKMIQQQHLLESNTKPILQIENLSTNEIPKDPEQRPS